MSPKPLGVSFPSGFTVYFTSTDPTITNDACSTLPASTPDLTNKVIIIQRGTCTFDTKYRNVAKAGGKVVLMYNTDDFMLPQLNVGSSGLSAVGGLTREAGLLVRCSEPRRRGGGLLTFALHSFSPTTGSTRDRCAFLSLLALSRLPARVLSLAQQTRARVVSCRAWTLAQRRTLPELTTDSPVSHRSFSGYGPTNELYGQPSYTAPGANILSTVALGSGGVGIMRGTSFAAPFGGSSSRFAHAERYKLTLCVPIAAATALILSARSSENLSPLEVRALLTTTASWVPTTIGSSTYETVILQGGGERAVAALTRDGSALTRRARRHDRRRQGHQRQNSVEPLPVLPQRYQVPQQPAEAHHHQSQFRVDEIHVQLDGGAKSRRLRWGERAPKLGNRSSYLLTSPYLLQPATQDVLVSPEPSPLAVGSVGARISFSTSSITIPAGQTKSIQVGFQPPYLTAADIARFPIYSGFVGVVGAPSAGGAASEAYSGESSSRA